MSTIVIPNVGMMGLLARLGLGGSAFSSWTIKLFKNDFVPDINTVLGDFVEADFTGYAGQVDTSGAARTGVYPNGDGARIPEHRIFRLTGLTRTNTIFGWYAVKTTGGHTPTTKLRTCQRFDEAVTLTYLYQAIRVDWRLIWGQPAGE